MAGILVRDTPAKLDASFSQKSEFDFIELRLRFRDGHLTTPDRNDLRTMPSSVFRCRKPKRLSVRFSSVYCAFTDLVRFLESITTGVQECAFEWDAEGPCGRFQWRRRDKETGFLSVEYWPRMRNAKSSSTVRTEQVVRMLYQAFRRFAESDAYDPLRYERLNIREQFELVIDGSMPGDLAAHVAVMHSRHATALLDCIGEVVSNRQRGGAIVRHSLEEFVLKSRTHLPAPPPDLEGLVHWRWIEPGWDNMNYESRRAYIEDDLLNCYRHCPDGEKLRFLRSERIEHWLCERPPSSTSVG